MLTARQKECFDFIRGYVTDNGGVSPSFQEIADALVTNSRGAVHRLLAQLELRGKISRLPNRARAIHVISPRNAQVIPLVSYPDAQCFVWDDEDKALKPMERQT